MNIYEEIFKGHSLVSFRCDCGHLYSVDDLNNDISSKYNDTLEDLADQRFCSIFDPGQKYCDGNVAEVIVDLPVECDKCGKLLNLEVLVEFEFYQEDEKTATYLDSVIQSILIDIPNATLVAKSGLFQGKDILSTLRWLFFRWSIIADEIHIISPFIDDENWKFLEHICRLIEEQVHKKCNITQIICRDINYFRNERFSLKQKLNAMVNERLEVCKNRINNGGSLCDDPDSQCNHKYIEMLINSVNFKSDFFHAKMYGAKIKEKSEVIFTSFNLLTYELKQYENFTMSIMDSKNFEKELKKL